MKRIKTPLEAKVLKSLKVGDMLLLNGVVYTARDQAHKRLLETIRKGKKLPLSLKGQIIYYCGSTKTPKKKTIGACGPTTSSRMDKFTPALLKVGLKGMVGKGRRSREVAAAIKKYKGVYFLTYAGCGALLSKFVKKVRPIAYRDLGPEAIRRLEVKDFPVIVAVDSRGRSIYKI